ncbi:uncharacterized protein LOC127096165 [Lathyrus oleraceus]|uniref:uncharacterized protein LOC127096165 n=1 Tax=Pisum sativum TaxID=3888 RepID=UPI0021D355C3|nr:uncharacterized protein LOC127096165 [Pisum sativum]
MKVLFDSQDVLEVIKNGVTPLVQNAAEAQQATHKEEKTEYFKVLFLIHQCIDGDNFEKVDDLLIIGSNEKCISKFKSELMEEFNMNNLGLMTYFLGIEFHKSKRGLLMHQRRYALEILENFEMEHCNASIASAEPRLQLSNNENEQDIDHTQYRRFSTTPISMCLKKEPVVPLSSCEAEYIATFLCVCQDVWLMNLLEELRNSECEIVTLLVDNVFMINLAKKPIAHRRSKHIEARFHYFIERFSEGRLQLGYCRSEDQVVDLLTKRLTFDVFKRLKMSMSMIDLQNLN